MGKLHEIKRAFKKLPHERKIEMHKSNQRFYSRERPYGAVYDTVWKFTYGVPNYCALVTQLVEEYYSKYVNQEKHKISQQKHAIERAYLAGERWAITIIENNLIRG